MQWPTDDDAADARKVKVVRLKSNMVRATSADAKAHKKEEDEAALAAAAAASSSKSSKKRSSHDSDDDNSAGSDDDERSARSGKSKRSRGGDSDDDGEEEEEKTTKKKNKKAVNRPQEMTTTQRVSRLRPSDITGLNVRKTGQDPRFTAYSAGVGTGFSDKDKKMFAKNYSFVDELMRDDVKSLTAQIKQARASGDEAAALRLHALRARYSTSINEKKALLKADEERSQYAQEQKALAATGKMPFYLKKSDEKQLGAGRRFLALAEKGLVDKKIAEKREKITQKDKSYMPLGRICPFARAMQSYPTPETPPSALSSKRESITTQIRLLTVNDIYTLRDTNGLGGYATLKTIVKAHEKPHSLFVVNGDVLGGSKLCESFHGEPAVAILNAISPDIAAVGNHEFDYGENQLEALMRDSQFPWVGGNIRRKSQGGRLMRGITPYVMYDYTIDSTGAVVGRKQVFDPMAASLLVAKPDWDTQDYPPVPLQELHLQAKRTASARCASDAAAAVSVAAGMKAGRVPAAVPTSAPAPVPEPTDAAGASMPAGPAPIVTTLSTPASAAAAAATAGVVRSRANSVDVSAAPPVAAAGEAQGENPEEDTDNDDDSLAAKVYLSTPCSRALFNPPLLRALSSSKRAADVFAAQGGASPLASGVVAAEGLVVDSKRTPATATAAPAAGSAGVASVPEEAAAEAEACSGEVKSADVLSNATDVLGVAPFYTLRIGFIGVCTVHTPTQSFPTKDVIFDDAAESAAYAAGIMKNVAHCDVVVGLTHLALREDIQVLQATPDIALSLGGHEHTPILTQQDTRFVYKTGQNAQYLGIVDMNITFPIPAAAGIDSDDDADAAAPSALPLAAPATDASAAITAAAVAAAASKLPVKVADPVAMLPSFQLIANMGYQPDKATESVISVYEAKLEELLALGPDPMRVLVTITGNPLETRTTFTRASAASGASMIADAFLACHKEVAQAACINGGFVRGDTFYPPGHALLYKELMNELPFPKTTSVLRMTGAVWKEGLEQQLMNAPKPTGAHPHYTSNVEIEYDPSLAVGSRVLSLKLDGKPVEPDQEYTVVMTAFMAGGGDGLVAFQKATVLPQGEKDEWQVLEITTRYLDSMGGFYEPDTRENVRAVNSSA